MSTSQNGSRLGQMKARFQQKQLQEKEEKLTKLYENQQQRTLERVVKTRSNIHSQFSSTTKSIGSSGETSPATLSSGNSSIGSQLGRGRVRQLFEERRQNKIAGIDKSYPLEPIKGTKSSVIKNDTKTTATRINSFSHTSSNISIQKKQHSITNSNIQDNLSTSPEQNDNDLEKVTTEEQYNIEQHNIEQMMNRHNLFESLDDENFPDVELIDDDLDTALGGKLPNIARTLPSEKLTVTNNNKLTTQTKVANGKLKSINQPTLSNRHAAENKTNIENNSRKTETFKRRTNTFGAGDATRTTARVVPKKTEFKQPINTKSNTRKSDTEFQKSKVSPSPENLVASKSTTRMNKVKSPPRPTSATIAAKSSERRRPNVNGSPITSDNLKSCQYCNRRFADDRLPTHEKICAKTANRKRKPYDATKHRVLGTEAEVYVRKGTRKQQPQAIRKTDWRQTHEEFIKTIRAAKQVQQILASGGSIKDLPPPPPSTNPDYVQCPHCGRKFNESAAGRHIPKCANYMFNKPKSDNKNIKKR